MNAMTNEQIRIISAAADLGIPKPQTVTDAEAFEEAATVLLDSARAETAPNLEEASAKTVAKIFAAAVEFESTHEARVRHAEKLVSIAGTRLRDAWLGAFPDMQPSFAAEFDKWAGVFVKELAKLGDVDAATVEAQHYNPAYADVQAAAARLSELKAVRDAYAIGERLSITAGTKFGSISRCLILRDHALVINLPGDMWRLHARPGVEYWAIAARHPGMTIKWQTVAQQEAQPAVEPFVRARAEAAALTARYA